MQEEQSRHGSHHTSSSQVSDESEPTLAELRSRIKGQKTKSLREIYEQYDEELEIQILHY